MTKLVMLCVVGLTALALPEAIAAREIALRAECLDDTGEGTSVRVYESLDVRGGARHLTGVIEFPNGEQSVKRPLGSSQAGANAIWRGNEFLLRIRTENASSSDLFSGRFRGLDDSGEPIILRSLSCTLSNQAASDE